ncbi:MinD/ParA family protein [Clostridium brassicae]|uniref:MinD/ParA family protein n=1 Tax=Clostridium brassicae TaxID=2999072 RepID=A0ABT4DBF0_9CLOT|nr:MinD/ParA family protein [Clostridium brassicae]MCY6959617.1 MinD/ParA family protein [Clostridium brassicae]
MLDQAQTLRRLAQYRNNENSNHEMLDMKDNDLNSGCKIITITSGKGGVGKSNFVVNLGITLQRMGKSVLIFDADVGMGNDDVLMGFLPKYNIYDIILKNMDIEDVVIEGPYGIKLLPAGSGLNRLDEINEEQREAFFNKLNLLEGLDFILMDTGAGINRSVLGFIDCCDEVIIVTTPEPTSITDAYSLMKAVSYFKVKKSSKIVVNKVIEEREGKATFSKLNNAADKFLDMRLQHLGDIKEDRKLVQAVRAQKPFVINYPNCDASKDIEKIALKLCGSNNEHNKKGEVKGLFEKIFRIFT